MDAIVKNPHISDTDLTYTAFGLTISSCISLPEVLEGAAAPDVKIVYGAVPEVLPDRVKNGVRYQVASGKVLIVVDSIGRFLVQDGKEVVIDRHEGADDDVIRLFLLGPVCGALLHQRGILVLHASAVKIGEGSALFLGKSGIGKSTLAIALRNKGYPVLNDNLCAVSFCEDDIPLVIPSYPHVKLWGDSLRELGLDATGLRQVRPGLEKRILPLGDGFVKDPYPLTHLYLLHRSKGDELAFTSIEGRQKFKSLMFHTYCNQFLTGPEVEIPHFQRISSLATCFPITSVSRPNRFLRLEEFVTMLEEDFCS